jgi:hypothetical protein
VLRLKPDKSARPDDMHPLIMKGCAESVSIPLSLIYKKSLDAEKVPRAWKVANLSPVFKKGKQTDPANYRPISLTSVACKIMET